MTIEFRPIRVAVGHAPAAPAPRNGNGHGQPDEAPAPAATTRPVHTPWIDIREEADGLILEADLPGASEDAVEIQLEENVLHLRAAVAADRAEGSTVLHEEFRPGDFHRSFILSDEVDRDRISAELKHGVLRLHLPKAERNKARRIEIKSS